MTFGRRLFLGTAAGAALATTTPAVFFTGASDFKDRLDLFVAAVRDAAPRTRILPPDYLTPYTFTR
jgi:hypothetical protein